MPKVIEISEFSLKMIVKDGGGTVVDGFKPSDRWRHDYVDGMLDSLESFLLAMACRGIDITSPEMREAIQTTLDAIDNES